MIEWKPVTLKNITTKIGSGSTPTGGGESYKDVGISLVRSQNILDFKFSEQGLAFIDENQAYELRSVTMDEEDVLLNITGDSVARCCMIPKKILPARVNQHVAIIRANKEIAKPHYLLYNLIYQKDTLLTFSEVGATRRALTKSMIEDFELLLPPLPEQERIAQVLSSLDDKIDLLNRNNKTLEQLAETLFRLWFVEEADMSKGLKLKDYVDTANTGLDAIKRAPIVEKETGIKCLRIQDISQQKPFNKWGNSEVEENNYKRFQLTKGDIIMARTCSPGINYFVREDLSSVFNNGLVRIRANKNKVHPIFLYQLFKTRDFIGHIDGVSGGTSVQLNMQIGDLLDYDFTFIDKVNQDEIVNHFLSIDEKILYNLKQIQQLETLRDTLLPKLMSGVVRVN